MALRASVRSLALLVLVVAACAAPPRGVAAGDATAVLGTWAGKSTCVGDRPACKNEDVVYRFLTVDGKPGLVTLLADKIVDGKRVPMGALDFAFDEAHHSLTGEFTRGQTHGLWEFTVSGDTMTGTLVVLPDRSLARRVEVRRVRDDEVPAAPARDEYEE